MARNIWGDKVYNQKRGYHKTKWTKQDEFFHYLKILGLLALTACFTYLIWF